MKSRCYEYIDTWQCYCIAPTKNKTVVFKKKHNDAYVLCVVLYVKHRPYIPEQGWLQQRFTHR